MRLFSNCAIFVSVRCFAYGCSSDSVSTGDQTRSPGDSCHTSKECPEDTECIHSVCTKTERICGDKKCETNQRCIESECVTKCGEEVCSKEQTCVEGKCVDKCGTAICDETQECVPGEFCLNGTKRCGESCCEVTQICGTSQRCCERDEMCGRNCCSENEVCEYEMCHLKCEENRVRCQDENGVESFCGADEICVSNQCFKPSVSCIDNYICEETQFCDAVMKTCLPLPGGEACKSEPSGWKVEPTLLWYWGEKPPETFPQYTQVMSSPMVADVNNDTIPEVVFNSYLVGNNRDGHGIVRIVNGQTGELIVSSDGVPFTDGGSNVALGNLDDDPYIEIVTCDEKRRLLAYKYIPGASDTGIKPSLQVMWKSNTTYNECYMHGPGIVDAIIAKGGSAQSGTHGVRAFASPDRDWVNTRKVNNQHAYSVTNVSDDASIPTTVKQNWKISSLNNFRQNVQPGATYLPDLEIRDVSSPYDCPSPTPIYFSVVNVGWATANKDIPINIWASKEKDGEYQHVGTFKTTNQLGASNREYLTLYRLQEANRHELSSRV